MPNTTYIELKINNQIADIGDVDELGITMTEMLSDPEEWESKQGSDDLELTLPSTDNNDKIFNTFYNPQIEDTSAREGSISSLTITTPGFSYAIGNQLYINGGIPLAIFVVDTISGGGGILTGHIIFGGAGFAVGSLTFTTTITGVGTSCTVTIDSIENIQKSFRNLMFFTLSVNSVIIMKGKLQLENAIITDKPQGYEVSLISGNGDWIIDMQNVTLWDCLNTTPHTFDVSTIETSWKSIGFGGYDSDEFHDFVYAPIRYRQPFGNSDDTVNIYHLRPSISIYWIIIRAFRLFGYSVNSDFFSSSYFRRLVLPWVWGDFYDINSQLTDGLAFKVVGDINDVFINEPPPTTGFSGVKFWTGSTSGTTSPSPNGSSWWDISVSSGLTPGGGTILPTGGEYIFTGNIHADNHFRMNDVIPPNGFDNFGLFSFDDTTGIMRWDYNPPSSISNFFGTNITANFELSLLLVMTEHVGGNAMTALEIKHYFPTRGLPTTTNNYSIMPSGGCIVGATHYPDASGYPITPTIYKFSVSGIWQGDYLEFRIRALEDGGGTGGAVFFISQAGFLNVNPSSLGANPWQWNPTTERWENINGTETDNIWQREFSYLKMTGLQLELGNQVHFQWYDAFRNYMFFDMLRGLIEMFDLEIKTNPIDKTVTIEPFSDTKVSIYDQFGTITGIQAIVGFCQTQRILDYSNKLDISQKSYLNLFKNYERQIDFSLKQDGSDGGQNIFSARNKGTYLNNVIKPILNNTSIENGIIASIPGASRFMLCNRFSKGNKQKTNSFFSATMHYKHESWKGLDASPSSPAPQLITIFPENINDSSASAVTQIFEPKIAFYRGLSDPASWGHWRWVGDPLSPYTEPTSITFPLPFLFSVSYMFEGELDPVLTYSDQLINGNVVNGLMKKYFLSRLAIMNNGQLYKPYLRLNLNDITNWNHRECIIINGSLYAFLGFENYKPLSDESCVCTLWKFVRPIQSDVDSCYPSNDSILNNPASLVQYDLKYNQLLLFSTDIPQSF